MQYALSNSVGLGLAGGGAESGHGTIAMSNTTEAAMVSVYKLPKHILSKTEPKAQHEFACAWHTSQHCRHVIAMGEIYVRMVWQDGEDDVHSDHICVECWSE